MISLMDWAQCTGIQLMNNTLASGDVEYRYAFVYNEWCICVCMCKQMAEPVGHLPKDLARQI